MSHIGNFSNIPEYSGIHSVTFEWQDTFRNIITMPAWHPIPEKCHRELIPSWMIDHYYIEYLLSIFSCIIPHAIICYVAWSSRNRAICKSSSQRRSLGLRYTNVSISDPRAPQPFVSDLPQLCVCYRYRAVLANSHTAQLTHEMTRPIIMRV